jgi:DNA-directed RNA polymerase specialized sigma24 family protein
MPPTGPEVTELLHSWSRGDAAALERLVPLILDDLRRIARRHLRGERDGHTLEPTALVNEVYLKLIDQREADWRNREQFFAVASRIMRRLLLDYAKARGTAKRGKDAVITSPSRKPAFSSDEPFGTSSITTPRIADWSSRSALSSCPFAADGAAIASGAVSTFGGSAAARTIHNDTTEPSNHVTASFLVMGTRLLQEIHYCQSP